MSAISSALGGLSAAESLLNTSASRIAANGPSAQDSVGLIEASLALSANAQTMQVADAMQKSLIDVLG